jgi:pyridinium-3,5-biscarboxylic acid mononucleotide synthase
MIFYVKHSVKLEDKMDIRNLLEQVQNNEMSITQAEELLKQLPYEDLGFAKLDHHRELRSGFGEVIFCQGKSIEHLIRIYQSFHEKDRCVLGTRATKEQYEKVKEVLPMVEYDSLSRILSIQNKDRKMVGSVVVCTGGTSDIPVAEEAAQTAEFFGSNVTRIYDVGVAGIHRLLSRVEEIRKANCVIAVAGMEGALGGVVAGLVDKPVIAVPTSVGYGANFGGLSALLTMLNSCAEGLAVVNIDNGFGAGYIATQINRLGVH